MPKIDVYKGNRMMIPIDVAKKAKAYRCPWTNKIYATKRDYVKHLKNLRENRMHHRAREIIRERQKQELWNLPTFDDIIKWVKLHPEFLFERMLHSQLHSKDYYEKYRDTFIMEITYLDVIWSDHCSNTHCKPRNGVTNWDGQKILPDGTSAPRGYPGWTGRIEFKLNCDMRGGSEVLSSLGFKTGTGGGKGGNKYGYGVTLFADDWPELYNTHKFQIVEDMLCDNKLRNKYVYGKADYFKW